jgi:hypothetical protein
LGAGEEAEGSMMISMSKKMEITCSGWIRALTYYIRHVVDQGCTGGSSYHQPSS